jgi:hypothetical protein
MPYVLLFGQQIGYKNWFLGYKITLSLSNGNMINGKGCLRTHGGLFLRYYAHLHRNWGRQEKPVMFTGLQDDICKQKGV